jgi:hypothetical protein
MVWGAIGWDWKSPLILLTKKEGIRGICSKAYLEQVLEPVVFLWFDTFSKQQKKEFYFMEDGSEVHKGFAKLSCQLKDLRGFKWLPSSPDLNLIEKIWRWIKNEIT